MRMLPEELAGFPGLKECLASRLFFTGWWDNFDAMRAEGATDAAILRIPRIGRGSLTKIREAMAAQDGS
jgi:hypothetical protein